MKKLFLIGIVLVCLLVSLMGGYAGKEVTSQTATEGSITIVDSAGREVRVPQPLERIVALHGDAAEVIRALGAKDNIVGITKYMADEPEFWPELRDRPICGSSFSPNYEKIVELNPQVVIVYGGTFGFSASSELEEKMEPAGIKVVKLDCYKPKTIARDLSTLGLMLGRSERAAELINFFDEYLGEVHSRISQLKPEEKVRVYFEQWTDYKSVAEGAGYHDMVTMAGGINIFAGSGVAYPEVSPEAVLEKGPQVVIKNTTPKYAASGYTAADSGEMAALRSELVGRPGWANLEAVRNGRVFVISNEIVGGAKKPIGICYLAKCLYPDKFQDIDPMAMLKEYLEKFQGVPYRGIYVYPGLEQR